MLLSLFFKVFHYFSISLNLLSRLKWCKENRLLNNNNNNVHSSSYLCEIIIAETPRKILWSFEPDSQRNRAIPWPSWGGSSPSWRHVRPPPPRGCVPASSNRGRVTRLPYLALYGRVWKALGFFGAVYFVDLLVPCVLFLWWLLSVSTWSCVK